MVLALCLALQVVAFPSRGAVIAGEITWPDGDGPFPAVALVHGSGPVTRTSNASLVALFHSLGFAVLAYDKRGTGASGGSYRGVGVRNSDSMISLLGADAAAAARLLAANPRIDPARIGLAGGSQAGWVIAAALDNAPIRFFVALSGPAVTVGEEIYYSDFFEHSDRALDQVDSIMVRFSGPTGYDPMPDLAHGAASGLYLLGAIDRSVPTALSVARLRQLDARSSGRFTVIVFPTGDHALFDARTHAALPIRAEIAAWLDRLGIR